MSGMKKHLQTSESFYSTKHFFDDQIEHPLDEALLDFSTTNNKRYCNSFNHILLAITASLYHSITSGI